MLFQRLLLVNILALFMTSCGLFHEDMTEVDEFARKQEYVNAIAILNGYTSSYSKKYNSQLHLAYAEQILKNLKRDKYDRYTTAKEFLEKSLKLDPKNKKAKTYYLMLIKLIKKDFPEK